MKWIWMLVLLTCLNQTLMATTFEPNTDKESSEETSLVATDNVNSEPVTSSPENKEDETTEIEIEEEDKEEEDKEEEKPESKRAARGLELGNYGRSMKRFRGKPKKKIASPRRSLGPIKYGPPRHQKPASKYGPAMKYGPPTKYGPPSQYKPASKYGPPAKYGPPSKYGPSSHYEPVSKYGPPKMMKHPHLVYGTPIPIQFGSSDASHYPMMSEKKLMFQSLPVFPSQNFREETKAPSNHQTNYKDVIPVTEPNFDVIQSSVLPLATVTPSGLTESYTSPGYSYITSSAVEVSDDFNVAEVNNMQKTEFTYGLPMNYYGLPITASENMPYGKYKFGYRVVEPETGNDFGHEEERDGELTDGRYHVLLPDGRVQNVNYHADHTGYYADVSYKNGKLVHIIKEADAMQMDKDREHLYAPYQS